MQTEQHLTKHDSLKQCSLYTSVALGVPTLFMTLGLMSSENMLNILDWSFALLGVA